MCGLSTSQPINLASTLKSASGAKRAMMPPRTSTLKSSTTSGRPFAPTRADGRHRWYVDYVIFLSAFVLPHPDDQPVGTRHLVLWVVSSVTYSMMPLRCRPAGLLLGEFLHEPSEI